MSDKWGVYARKPELIIAVGVLAALTFNNWLLGPLLNKQLFDNNGSVSEFSAVTQPHYWVFRSLDIVSGILFILLALLASRQLINKGRARSVLIWGTAVMGLANIVDALFSLPCSETLNAGCQVPVNISLRHFQMPSHGYSSVIIAICYFVLPLAGFIYAYAQKSRDLIFLSALAVAVALESFLSALLQYAIHHSFSVKSLGFGQELQMIIVGIWFVFWILDACNLRLSHLAVARARRSRA